VASVTSTESFLVTQALRYTVSGLVEASGQPSPSLIEAQLP